jgi:hypothetical protein
LVVLDELAPPEAGVEPELDEELESEDEVELVSEDDVEEELSEVFEDFPLPLPRESVL